MFGEVGLAGEVRGIAQASLRVREAAQMGFRRCVMPEANIDPAIGAKASASWSGCERWAKLSTRCCPRSDPRVPAGCPR